MVSSIRSLLADSGTVREAPNPGQTPLLKFCSMSAPPGEQPDEEGFPTGANTVEFGFEDGPATGGRRLKAAKQAKKAKPGSFGEVSLTRNHFVRWWGEAALCKS